MKKLIQAIILVSVPLSLTDGIGQNDKFGSHAKKGDRCAQESPRLAAKRDRNNQYRRQTRYFSDDDSLNRLQDFFQPTLRANEKHFQGRAGFVKGFGAGRGYPQIWLRDSATIIPASSYYYPREFLTTWLEEHLSFQEEDGSLNDWIASGPRASFLSGAPRAQELYRSRQNQTAGEMITITADKNTTEADQETSAVDAAYQIFRITGDRKWLTKDIRGRTLLRRLDLSIEYLLKARFDVKYGLVTNAFTADWGDVSPSYDDQRAIYLDDKTPLVVGLYTNVLVYRAARELGELYLALNQTNKAAYWKQKAAAIKESINQNLWQEDKGFYRIHIVLTPPRAEHYEDESNLFAMGGNGLAVLYDVAEETQSRKIFEVAERRQREFGFSTIAGVLSPSYPGGFFKHPAVNKEYYYQNGGQWDWFAGRFLLAEFEKGYSARAYRQLVEIAKKTVASNGLYEWHTKDGKGMGSREYAGNAGALAGAVFQGLYGVYLTDRQLGLRIRLVDQAGQIQLYQPATNKYVEYKYCYSRTSNTVKLVYESNSPGVGRICVLLPNNRRLEKVMVEGKKRAFTTIRTGEDTYGCFSTDWKMHQSELKLAESPQG
jgi:mannosylglycerate hydrolase MGH1-like protein